MIEQMKIHSSTLEKFPRCAKHFPTHALSEGMAESNHDQSLKKLDERGGMGTHEILANLFKQPISWTKNNPECERQVKLINAITNFWINSNA